MSSLLFLWKNRGGSQFFPSIKNSSGYLLHRKAPNLSATTAWKSVGSVKFTMAFTFSVGKALDNNPTVLAITRFLVSHY